MSTAMTPQTATTRLLSRQVVADGTMAFHFEKPHAWAFKAGQYLDMTLIDPPETDAEGDIRSFTISSAPEEEALAITTRMRDTAFKRVLKTMAIGTGVKIEGPSGDLTLPEEASRPLVFLAGGIGITPFRSMLIHAERQQLPHRLFLFYSNHRPEDSAYLDELEALQGANPHFTLIASMSDLEKSRRPWGGETGFIDAAMLARHLGHVSSPVYYVAGPPAMVAAMHEMLITQKVKDADIHGEEFSGY
ncbi:MAG: FAD-dependent oxidoreductase [Vicinamibacterales bacterium]